mmetsp:Transcript_26316/g.81278  ORF Transcript_26316/g.81278 Transcript_26316/m.81278 type:complete len:259 (-) Transcript_26316:1958-2734(-)
MGVDGPSPSTTTNGRLSEARLTLESDRLDRPSKAWDRRFCSGTARSKWKPLTRLARVSMAARARATASRLSMPVALVPPAAACIGAGHGLVSSTARATLLGSSGSTSASSLPLASVEPAAARIVIVPVTPELRRRIIFITSTSQYACPSETCPPSGMRKRTRRPVTEERSLVGSASPVKTSERPLMMTRRLVPSSSRYATTLRPPMVICRAPRLISRHVTGSTSSFSTRQNSPGAVRPTSTTYFSPARTKVSVRLARR